ncbi:gliding motility-associated C-terminal domain-containing protein [Christiangramia echinicola]|uniref:Gliding motility-associated C-terminal domain-containing protein n=1 Tax=Christiangramia echinicola TaxID=279359 RepID=A0A1H1P339_9FLAO|nr:gliding motility-associated C-terminal domain-containing protein [Christiangramia echinicola]SDS05009.1 gliding motility-associated C-terminal domain-containing protein [Christiangramia echinicola]
MQNFTFGRKGLNWFLFAFILFVGNLSASYAQNCPTLNSNSDNFCYLDRVSELDAYANDGGDGIRWYRSATPTASESPIPDDEILQTGTYYAGNDSGDCATRPAFDVTVDDLGPPTSTFGNFYEPCEYSSTDVTTVAELKALINTTGSANDINVYDQSQEFGTVELNDGDILVEGRSYFVGQDDTGTSCQYSSRIAIRYDPILATAPSAEPNQTFCESSTVADLEAGGINRWYSTESSNPALDLSTPLVDGQTYYASRIVNRTNSSLPPCESQDRTAVTVTLIEGPDAGEQVGDGTVCESDVQETFPSNDEVRNFYLGLLEEGVPTDGTFNPTIDQIVSQYQNDVANDDGLGDFTTTYTIGEENCQDSVELTISVVPAEDAEAGDNFSDSYCIDQNENFDLYSFLSDDAIVTGEFSAPFEDGVFNPSEEGEGTYTITYSVNEGNSCVTGSDEATFTIEVNEVNEENITISIDPSEYEGMDENQILADLSSRFTPFFEGTPDFSAFDPDLETAFAGLDPQNPEGTYQVTYSGNPCEILNFTIIIEEEVVVDPVPGDPTGIVCENDVQETFPSIDEIRKYYLALLPEGTPRNGTFDPTPSELADMYQDDLANDDGLGDFTTTYTVNGNSFELTVTVIAAVEANAGDFDNIPDVCTGDAIIDLTTLINNDPDAQSGGTFSGTGVSGNMFDPSTGQGSYTITYTVDDSTGCIVEGDTDSTEFIITVVEGDANAGEDGTANLNENDDPVNLFDYLNGDPDTGGTWSPGNPDGSFDPGTDPEGDYMYTVTDGDCSDSAIVTVIIESDTNCTGNEAGSNNFGIVCLDDVQTTFPSVDETRKYILALRDSGVPSNGSFNPSISRLIELYNDDADGLGDFTTTYTVTVDGCTDSTDLTVRVVEEGPANAGDFDNIEDICSDEEIIDLDTLTNNDPDATIGGIFSGTGVTDNEFDPSVGAGTYTITYTVDESTPCTTGSDSAIFEITVEEAPVSANVNRSLCISEAQSLITDTSALTIYLNDILTEAGVESTNADGFDDEDLLEGQALLGFIENPTSDSETFNFSYVDESANSVCSDGLINIAVTINNELDAEAGTIEDQNVCVTDGMIDLSVYLGSDSISGGTFTGTGVSENMFDSSVGANEDGYLITYTVDDSIECVADGTTDSEDFLIFINNGVDAGDSNSGDVCRANVDDLFPNNTTVRNYYLNLLEDGVSRNGSFNPSIQQLITDYNANPEQDVFTTTYTITNGGCSDSVDLTINVYDSIPAVIGDITDPDPICRNAEDVDLFSFLPADANPNGTFEGYDNGVFSPSMEGAGTFTITYSLSDDSPCTEGTATADFIITVTESAYAGMDVTVPDACTNDTEVDLNGSISADADAGGVFTLDSTGEVIADGILDISGLATDTYTITYTVAEINDCGDDDATLTLTVSEAPAGPTVDGDPFTFCASNAPTGADLSATGSNLTFYSDAELSTMVMAEDALTTGTYYVTQRADDGGCESNATEFSVTVNDADTPTISDSTLEFCDFDDPTVADLSAEINETGTITWYDSADGDNALAEGTPLQDGTTYYAALFDADSGCESSVRLAVTALVENCPVVIPEGFSPNGDQLNDTFDIKFIEEVYPNYTIVIHNRYGDVVYRGNANTPDWDGFSSESSFGDNLLPVGAYFYYLDYNDGSTEPVRGTVYLSR